MGHPARPSQMAAKMSEDGMDPSGSGIDASMNGHSMNGHSLNGHDMNSHGLNAHTMYGNMNGHTMNSHGMANPAPAASASAPVFASAPAASARDDNAFAPTETAPADLSLNPEAPAFIPRGGAIPIVNTARMNPEHYRERALNIAGSTNETVAAANPGTERWALIWPPFTRQERASNRIQRFMQSQMNLVAQLMVSPVRGSDLPRGALLHGNPALPFRPRQPIPLVFLGAELLAPEIIAPLGWYWYLLTEVFRVTNEGQFQHSDYYRRNLDHLLWLVYNPRDEYEAFILLHFREWLGYHHRLFDDLLASLDRRRAMMTGPDRLLTAQRMYYVEQRAYVEEAIQRLEGWLLFVHGSQAYPVYHALSSLGLIGHVVEDSLQGPVRYDQTDGPAQGDDCQEGPGDVWPGNNEAPGDEEDPESANSAGMGQAEGHTISGPIINSGPSQPAQGPSKDGLAGGAHAARRWEEAGGGGKYSSQSADVEVGPVEGNQVVLPHQLR